MFETLKIINLKSYITGALDLNQNIVKYDDLIMKNGEIDINLYSKVLYSKIDEIILTNPLKSDNKLYVLIDKKLYYVMLNWGFKLNDNKMIYIPTILNEYISYEEYKKRQELEFQVNKQNDEDKQISKQYYLNDLERCRKEKTDIENVINNLKNDNEILLKSSEKSNSKTQIKIDLDKCEREKLLLELQINLNNEKLNYFEIINQN
jgi:hypothetical protein